MKLFFKPFEKVMGLLKKLETKSMECYKTGGRASHYTETKLGEIILVFPELTLCFARPYEFTKDDFQASPDEWMVGTNDLEECDGNFYLNTRIGLL